MATKGSDKFPKESVGVGNVTQAELDAAVAEYNAKLKTANDAIAGVKTSADKAATDITALAATVASNKTAQDAAVADTTAKFKTANDAIAAVKTTADKAATDIAALATRVGVIEKLDYNLENYSLDNGKLYTVTEAIGLNSLVHIRTDGKAELASDKDINKPADGIVLGAVAANSTTKIYGTGARIADLGQTGSLIGSRFYTGASGAISTSATGSGRLIQEVAVYNGSTYLLSFVDRGYWVA